MASNCPAIAPPGCLRSRSATAAPGRTAIGADVTLTRPSALNASTHEPTAPASVRLVNEATPPIAAVLAPVSEPPPDTIVAVTVAVDVVRLPAASRISITGCVVSGAPAAAPAGSIRITNIDAAPAASSNPVDVTGVRPPTLNASVRGPIAPLMASDVNVATPPTAVVVEPAMAPPPVATTAVTVSAEVTRFPEASRISTTGCEASGSPDAAPDGCVRMVSVAATPGVTVSLIGSERSVPRVAIICASPPRTPVTTPAAVTDAIVASVEVH